jgi:glycosyltransferase involved in cell wall biosynthesis
MSTVQRVLFLVPDLEHAGPTYNALTLGRILVERGMKVLTAALGRGEREVAFEVSDLPVLVDSHLGGWVWGRGARKRLRDFRPQIVHAMALSVRPVGMRLARMLGVPLVTTVNRMPTDGDEPLLLDDGSVYIAVSDAVHQRLLQGGRIRRERAMVLHNGVDLRRYGDPREAAEAASERSTSNQWGHNPVIGTFGALRQEKGQHIFLEAAAKVLHAHDEAEFVVMGRGPELANLRRQAAQLGITPRVTFTSGTTFATTVRDQIDTKLEAVYLKDFDIFVEPSTQEGLGLSVMQAMAWCRPVVASGVGGLYSLVQDGETGILVPKEDPAALADALCHLVAHPSEAEEMGRKGREYIESEFNARDVATRHRELYGRLLEGPAGAEGAG